MEPIEWVVGGLILLAIALSTPGCDDGDDSGGAEATDGGADDSDAAAPPAPAADAGPASADVAPDGSAAPDPRLRDGFNGDFANPTSSFQLCPIVDLDISGDRITGMCGPNVNRMFQIDVDANHPLDAVPVVMGAAAPVTIFGTPGRIVPAQVQEVEGGYVVPFSAEEAPLVCGLSFIAPDGEAVTKLVDPIDGVSVSRLQSCIETEDGGEEGNLSCAAWDTAADNAAKLLSYRLTPDGVIDRHDDGELADLPGAKPVSITRLGGTTVAIVRLEGLAGPAIDVVDLSEGEPAAVIATIALPRAPLPRPELAVTEDGSRAAILTQDGYLLLVDLVGGQVEGEVNLGGAPRDVAISGAAAYVSNENAVQVVDISDPQNPQVMQTIDGLYDLGSIAVHSTGTIYVAATARWWEGAEAAAACLAGDPAAVCRTHIVAIDPMAAQPITPPAGGVDGGADGG